MLGQFLRQPIAAVPAAPDPALLRPLRRAHRGGRLHAELVDDAKAFLSGKSQETQRKLGEAMEAAAKAMDFELAAVFRDRLRALTFIQGSQAINAGDDAQATPTSSRSPAMPA